MPGVVHSEILLPVASESHPFVLGRKILKGSAFVLLVVNRLPHVLEKLARKISRQDPGRAPSLCWLASRGTPFKTIVCGCCTSPSEPSAPPVRFQLRSPAPFFSKFLITFLVALGVIKNRTLQKFWFACFQFRSTTTLSVVVSLVLKTDDW